MSSITPLLFPLTKISASASPDATLSNSDSGNDKAWIAGPIVGSIVGFLALVGLILFLATRKRNKNRALQAKEAQEAALMTGAGGAGAATSVNATPSQNNNMLGVGAGAGAGAAAGGLAGAGAAAAGSRRSSTPSSHSRRDSLLARSNSDRSMFRSQSEHSFSHWDQQSRNSHDLLSAAPNNNGQSTNSNNRHSVASPLDELVRSFSVRKARK